MVIMNYDKSCASSTCNPSPVQMLTGQNEIFLIFFFMSSNMAHYFVMLMSISVKGGDALQWKKFQPNAH